MSDNAPPSNPVASNSYHCLCTTLILATKYSLESLPQRAEPALDQAFILPLSDGILHSTLHNISTDGKRSVIRREDGFEMRLLLRCTRCKLVIGYKLDAQHFKDQENANPEQLIYILPGGLVSTEDMQAGKMPTETAWAQQEA